MVKIMSSADEHRLICSFLEIAVGQTIDTARMHLQMGFHFAGKAMYTALWVAAVSLFMELLGFSSKKLLIAGGFGTVLLTPAGREIFTNFLSSAMIHATRPVMMNEWIQTRIEGYEVSGFVENIVADMRKILVSCFVKTSYHEEYLCVKVGDIVVKAPTTNSDKKSNQDEAVQSIKADGFNSSESSAEKSNGPSLMSAF